MLRIGEVIKLFGSSTIFGKFYCFGNIFVSDCPKNMFFGLFWRDFLGIFTTRSGPGLEHSPAGPGHLWSGPVQTWVHQVQDQTLDSLCLAQMCCVRPQVDLNCLLHPSMRQKNRVFLLRFLCLFLLSMLSFYSCYLCFIFAIIIIVLFLLSL